MAQRTISGETLDIVTTLNLRLINIDYQRTTDHTTDASTYSAGDLMTSKRNSFASPIELTGMAAANGGAGYIRACAHTKNSLNTTGANFRLMLYSIAPTPVLDNDPWPFYYSLNAGRQSLLDLNLHEAGPTGSDSTISFTRFLDTPYQCASGSTSLWLAGINVQSTYTPGIQEQHNLKIYYEFA